MNKLRIAILFGGRSAEHEVSLQSARNVIEALDRKKYDPVLIGIDKTGRWFLNRDSIHLLNAGDPRTIQLAGNRDEVALTPNGPDSHLFSIEKHAKIGQVDVLFPVLHGPYGEDGTIQGLARLADLPCVGAGVIGSAVGMDKDIMKRLLKDHGIPVCKFITVHEKDRERLNYQDVTAQLGPVLFLKPANLGSSVGISRAEDGNEFMKAVDMAFAYDTKIIIEEEVKGREIECAVLGNEYPKVSVPGEITPKDGFYSYAAKYIDDEGAALEIPAKLPDHLVIKIQDMAAATFKALECRGMARVDFFLTSDEDILVNEINTIPGFTKISMYPKLWEYSGISNRKLIDKLIQLAIEEFEKRRNLKTGMEFEK